MMLLVMLKMSRWGMGVMGVVDGGEGLLWCLGGDFNVAQHERN